MVNHDLLSDMFSSITNAEKVGKDECVVPRSKLIVSVLEVMKKTGYVNSFEITDDGRGGFITVSLSGKLNKASVIKPRFPVKTDGFVKWEERFLPSASVGILIISTPIGVMTHHEASEKKTGGKLLGFVY
ncbi:30S ribosomal protein S8 [archaeon]|nr:30S ribosomal protein S8 [archaeon]